MSLRAILILLAIAAVIGGIWAYTSWQRGDAAALERGNSVQTTVTTTDKATGIKNEIRKRPISDNITAGRLSNGTW